MSGLRVLILFVIASCKSSQAFERFLSSSSSARPGSPSVLAPASPPYRYHVQHGYGQGQGQGQGLRTSSGHYAKSKKAEDYSETFDKWYRSALAALNATETLTPVAVEEDYRFAEGRIGRKEESSEKDNTIVFSSEAYKSAHLDYFRMVQFSGAGYTVLNVVAFPNLDYELPIFGVDIVILPGGSLAAIDFQPLESSPQYLDSDLYAPFKSKLKKWKAAFPSGGDLPVGAEQYFSPLALWTKFPAASNAGLLVLLGQALQEYLECYSSLLASASPHSDPLVRARRLGTLREYLDYRIENDPAQRLLNAAFGAQWTEQVLREVLFPVRVFE